jgi:hypothetical protein
MEQAQAPDQAMLDVARGRREYVMRRRGEPRSIGMLAQAVLPPWSFGDMPEDAARRTSWRRSPLTKSP